MLFVSIKVLAGKKVFVKNVCLCEFIVSRKYLLICIRGLQFDMGAVFITMTGIHAV